MKKTCLFLLLLVAGCHLTAQLNKSDSTAKKFQNIIMIDATRLLTQFLGSGGSGYDEYLISYRRIFNRNALRVGIGGDFSSYEDIRDDTSNFSGSRNYMIVGLGMEHYSELSRRWTLFWGADVKISSRVDKRLADFPVQPSETNYSKTEKIGFGPLLGIIFHFHPRMALSTETSLSFYLRQHQKSGKLKSLHLGTEEAGAVDLLRKSLGLLV